MLCLCCCLGFYFAGDLSYTSAAMDDKNENLLPSPPSQLLSIDEEIWKMVEERAQEILWTIEPNLLSEENRKDVIDYVRSLIGDYYGAHVRI